MKRRFSRARVVGALSAVGVLLVVVLGVRIVQEVFLGPREDLGPTRFVGVPTWTDDTTPGDTSQATIQDVRDSGYVRHVDGDMVAVPLVATHTPPTHIDSLFYHWSAVRELQYLYEIYADVTSTNRDRELARELVQGKCWNLEPRRIRQEELREFFLEMMMEGGEEQ